MVKSETGKGEGPGVNDLNDLIPPDGLCILGTARYSSGTLLGKTVLAMVEIQSPDHGWPKYANPLVIVTPGVGYKPGQILKEFREGTKLASTVFRRETST